MHKRPHKEPSSIFLVSTFAAAAVLFLSFVPIAHGAPKYTRGESKIKIKVKQTERTAGLEKKDTKEKEKTEPQLTANDVIELQGRAKHIKKYQIREFERLIEVTDPDSSDLPKYYFQLADLWAQGQRYWRFRGREMDIKIDKAKAAQKRQLKAKQASYFKEEKRHLLESLKVYSKVANNPAFKNYPRMDEVLFYFAYTLEGAGRIKESRKIFHKLISGYPKSKYIPQAHLAFADYFFQHDDLENASRFYDRVLKFPESSVYSYALYKKGWVYLNQDKPQEALETFFKVANLTKGKKDKQQLNKVAKKDFVRAYAEVGRAEKAYKAFQRVDKGYAFNMLKILGTIYLDQGQAEKAIYTYREMIKLRSKDPEVCEWQGNVLTAMLSTGNQEQKAKEIVNLVKVFLNHKKAGILKGPKLAECQDNAQGTTGEMAKIWHNEAIKTRNTDALGSVEDLYQLYVESFPKAKDLGEMQFYYADLLWQRAEDEKNPRLATNRFEKAAIAFTDVVQQGHVDKKLLKEAAYAAVLGWKNALAVDPRTKATSTKLDDEAQKAEIPKPRPIGEREKKMISAFDVYIKYITDPSDEELVMMKFLKARIYWRHDRLKESLPFFYEIVEKHGEHETATYAANIIIDSLIRLKEYNELNKFTSKMLKDKKFLEDKDELLARLQDIKIKGLRIAAQDLEKKGEHLLCGEAYEAIYNANPDGDGMDEVLYNSGVCYEQGKSIGLAIRAFSILDKKFPKSTHSQRALVRMGAAYGAIAHYDKAAEKYEKYADKYPGEKDAPDALQNAVTYRKGIGDDKEAIKNITDFVDNYKNKLKAEAAAALFGLAGIYEKQGNDAAVIKTYKTYIAKMKASGGTDRLLIANAKIGEILWRQSCKKGTVNDACIVVKRERATRRSGKRQRGRNLPTQCGPESKIKVTVLDRDRRKVAEARKYFNAAVRLSQKAINSAGDDGRKAAAIYWMAASKFYLVGPDFEKFLAIEFPTKLDFNPRNQKRLKESQKRFKKWLQDKVKLAEKLNKNYTEVRKITGGGAAWAVAAAAREGQVSQNFADALFTAEIPKVVRTGPYAEDGVDAYCDALAEQSGPLEEKSIVAYGFCLDLSTKLNWFNDWSRMCETELGQIRPADFPTATEFHGTPDAVAAITDVQGLVTTIAQ